MQDVRSSEMSFFLVHTIFVFFVGPLEFFDLN